MMVPGRRTPVWKLALLVAGTAAGLLLFAVIGAVSLIDRKWKEMEMRLSELAVEASARDPRRRPMEGDPVPGNAWDDYTADAVSFQISANRDSVRKLWKSFVRAAEEDPNLVNPILDRLGPAFEDLRRGSRKMEGQFPHHWGNLDWNVICNSPAGRHAEFLSMAAGCEARRLAQSGKRSEAVGLLLAAAQLGHDAAHNGTLVSEMIGMGLYRNALDELREMVQSGTLNQAELLQVDRGLDRLDQDFVRASPCMRNEILMIGQLMASGQVAKIVDSRMMMPDLKQIRPTWRQLFSRRLLEANAFLLLDRGSRRLATDNLSYPEEQRIWNEVRSAVVRGDNPLASVLFISEDGCKIRRGRLAELRLVRVAAHYRATGEVLALGDPFGTTLRHAVAGENLKVWSIGQNGVDDGGQGTWRYDRGLDIVLETHR